jgi:hypothetical protein
VSNEDDSDFSDEESGSGANESSSSINTVNFALWVILILESLEERVRKER